MCTGLEPAALAALVPEIGGGTASLFGPGTAALSSLAASSAAGTGLLASGSPLATMGAGMAGAFGPLSAAGATEAGIMPMAAEMGAQSMGGAGLPWAKMAELGGRGLLSQQQQPQQPQMGQMPQMGGAPQQFSTAPQPSQQPGMPLGGAQAITARLQGMDPMMMMRLQQMRGM